MALKPEDHCGGFRHSAVVAYINEKMAMQAKGSEFYLDNIALSWEEAEDKLMAILEDSEASSEAKEACAWGCLALGVRFSRRQNQLQECRVKWLHDLAEMHKSAAQSLASDLKEISDQQEIERRETAFRLRLAQDNLVEVQKEWHLLRWKLLQAPAGGRMVRNQPMDYTEKQQEENQSVPLEGGSKE
ncbi:testis-expressed protein 13B [Erinaceus europaeus]|uniref:Testis-expressed protein 13B n=1 Tax=Erinaceus europaeus TaxID=9365 RepID=A0ABM3WRG5_ERIEU|nr:testis-expressed protein 13B [Erinaceus europaeus]